MAPVPETALPTESKNDATGNTIDGSAPTRVDAYRSRGIRSTHSPLDLVPIVLRILLTVFTLIAFAIIASDSVAVDLVDTSTGDLLGTATYKFSDFFFFSYLLTVNVIAFTYALATIFLSFFTLSKSDVSRNVLIAVFALDLILSYLLMSASTSAATGLRLIPLLFTGVDKFREKAAAAVAFSYLAFFVLAPAALLSGLRLARR